MKYRRWDPKTKMQIVLEGLEGKIPPSPPLSKGGKGGIVKPSTLPERIYIKGRADPIIPPADSSELLLLERIRDEAHRFAITYHKKLRQRQYYVSPLDKIPGIGDVRKKSLMKHFGNVENIRQASVEQLKEVEHISEKQAVVIYNYFHKGT